MALRAAGPRTALVITSAAVFVAYLDLSVVNVALPTIAEDFDSTLRTVGWVATGYSVAFTALLVTAGRLADARGRRSVFIGGTLLFALASALCTIAWSVESLVAFRVLQGVGAAVLGPVSLALLLPYFTAATRGAAIGLWGTAGALAAGLGPPLGGLLTAIDWRLIFLINVPVCLGAALGARLFLKDEAPRSDLRLDPTGVVALTLAVGCAALAITQAPAWGWTSPAVVGLLAVSLTAAAALAVLERRSDDPILDVALFRIRSFRTGTVASTLFYFGYLGYAISGVVFLQSVWGFSPALAGLAYMLGPLLSAALNTWGGRLVDRRGARRVGIFGFCLFISANALFALTLPAEPHWLTRFLPLVLLGSASLSFVFPALTTCAIRELPQSMLGSGTGVLNTIRQAGGTLGIAATVTIIGGLPHSPGPFQAVYAMIAASSALALTAFVLGTRPR